MGSLASRPKVPKTIQKPVYIPVTAPAVSTSTAAALSNAGVSSAPARSVVDTPAAAFTADPEGAAAQARSMGLLERQRGILGTVLTSFRGILGTAAGNAPQRKTLLGE